MNKKRLIIIANVLLMCFVFSACSKDDKLNSNNEESSDDGVEEINDNGEKIDFSSFNELTLGNKSIYICNNKGCILDDKENLDNTYNQVDEKLIYFDNEILNEVNGETLSEEGDNDSDIIENSNNEATTDILSIQCENLNWYNNNLMFTSEGKIYTCGKKGENLTEFNQLTDYYISMMYVVQDEFIIFASGGDVYQYNIKSKELVDYYKANVYSFIPTNKGIIYCYLNDNECFDVYAEDNLIVNSADSNSEIYNDKGYFVYTDKNDGDKIKQIKIENMFGEFADNQIEEFNLYE